MALIRKGQEYKNTGYTKEDLHVFSSGSVHPGYYIEEPKFYVPKIDYMDLAYFCSVCRRPILGISRKKKKELHFIRSGGGFITCSKSCKTELRKRI